MTPFEKAVEAGAMAIQQTDYSNVGVSPWDHMPERSKAMFKSESRAALTAALIALESEGETLCSVDQMAEAVQYIERGVDDLAEYANCLSREPHCAQRLQTAADMIRAMLAARPKAQQEGE